MAKIFISQGRVKNAEPLLLRVINQNPKFKPAYNDLAEIKIMQRQTNEAIKILSDSLNKNGSDPTTLNNLGMCWMIKRNYEKALQHFTEAAGLQPENTRYRANMAVALAFLERDDEALAVYKQILPEDQAKHNLESIQKARG
jgi:tetratricopeptide (TPR) repeat protein